MRTLRPRTDTSAPYRRRQRPLLSTTTGGAASASSSAVKARPSCGAMPSSGISDAVTREPLTRSGVSSSPSSVYASRRMRARLEKLLHAVPCGVVERRRLELEDVVLGQRLPDEHEPRRIAIWQRLQQDGVQQREHGAVHAESERQGQRHEQREPRPPGGGAPRNGDRPSHDSDARLLPRAKTMERSS